jgi:hypothetical protein
MISRYLLLFLFTLPFIIAGVINIITQFKLNRIRKARLVAGLLIWTVAFLGLLFAEPIYNWLYLSGLTQSDSLSLFDVMQITAIALLFYIVNQQRLKLEVTERRLKEIHKEISIRLSK